jgi:hypothetical protein
VANEICQARPAVPELGFAKFSGPSWANASKQGSSRTRADFFLKKKKQGHAQLFVFHGPRSSGLERVNDPTRNPSGPTRPKEKPHREKYKTRLCAKPKKMLSL